MCNDSTSRSTIGHRARSIRGAVLLLALAGCSAGTHPAGSLRTDGGNFDAAAWQEDLTRTRAELEGAPNDAALLFRLASLYDQADSSARAVEFCERALAEDPRQDSALSLWSKLQFEAGEHTVAIQRLESALEQRGTLPDALRTGLALHYDAAGRWEESSRAFDSVRTPNSAKVYHVLRGDDFLHAGDLARAALEAEPNSAASHNNFGITRLYAGDPESARAAFLRALELEPELSGALYNLAIVDAFYFFDETQGRKWYERYRATGALEDPDGLGELLATTASTIGEQAKR